MKMFLLGVVTTLLMISGGYTFLVADVVMADKYVVHWKSQEFYGPEQKSVIRLQLWQRGWRRMPIKSWSHSTTKKVVVFVDERKLVGSHALGSVMVWAQIKDAIVKDD